jgi:hypothetical protein
MSAEVPVFINAAVEGIVDEAVVKRLIKFVGGTPSGVFGKNGKSQLRMKINGYNNAAHLTPWVVLVDLDHDTECAPLLRNEWLPHPASKMCFRVAVHEVETWLLADRVRIARFLGVSQSVVPRDPETIDDPKKAMVDLAKRSRWRAISEDMVPREGSGRPVGPAYTSRLMEFAGRAWSPEEAMDVSDSLRRCVECLRKLVKRSLARERS